MQIRLTTLGAARVYSGDIELSDLPAQRLRFALLLYLAVERDVSREEVVAMFWPDRDTARGRHALRQMLYELRQVLGEDWIDMRRDRIVVNTSVDAADFEAAANAGRTIEALELYGGPFLAGFSLDNRTFEGWADRRRAHLGRLHRRLRRDHIAQLVADGRTDDALMAARRWVELDPLEDEAAHTLIARLAAAGQRTAALQYYENYERQLRAELQVEPLEETTALIDAIRNGDAAVPMGGAGESTDPAPARTIPAPAGQGTGSAPAGHGTGSAPTGQGTGSAPAGHGTGSALGQGRTGWRTGPARLWRNASVLQRSGAIALFASLLLLIPLLYEPPPATQAAGHKVSIAMLPMSDHSQNGTLEPLTAALTETLAHSMAQSQFLDIISPNGVLLLRARGTPEDSLGRLLGADYLVGGNVTRYDDRVVVDIELLDGRTGKLVGTEVVERPWAESHILVEDVVRGAAEFLRREVNQRIEIERVRARASNAEAWQLVLEAKAVQSPVPTMLRAREYDAARRELARSDSILKLAASLDRDWAEPVVLRGWIQDRLAFIARLETPQDTAGRRALLRAGLTMLEQAESDGDDAAVHELRGTLEYELARLPGQPVDTIRSRLAEAEEALRRATMLDPFRQSSWRRLADLLLFRGQYGQAKVAAERAYRLDWYAPDAHGLVNLLFATTLELGQDDQAEGWCLEARRRFAAGLPNLYCLYALHAWADGIPPDPALLRRDMAKLQDTNFNVQPQLMQVFDAMLAVTHARAGQPDSARHILRNLDGRDAASLWTRAAAHAALHEDSAAIALLRDFLALGNWEAPRIATSRPFARLRNNPEVQKMVENAIVP